VDGASTYDQADTSRWPPRKVIWSCDASRGPLLTRYFLVHTPLVGIFLHHLHASDEDRALHDHPWSFVTCLLTSGYYEHTPDRDGTIRRTWRRRFSVLYRPAEWQHRLELVRPTWTLMFRWRRRRVWGFFTPGGWVDWVTYGKEWCD
jgi:hypothetical protein